MVCVLVCALDGTLWDGHVRARIGLAATFAALAGCHAVHRGPEVPMCLSHKWEM